MPRPYDASRTALYSPGQDTAYFPRGRPVSEVRLCAAFARLAYAPFETEAGARLVQGALDRIGFPECRFFQSAATDSQALLAHDPGAGLTIIAFRGTESHKWRDLKADLQAWLDPWPGGGRVHHGFAEALMDIWKSLGPVLGGDLGRVLYTGHSLGAALATLALSLRAPEALYTFGCPRVGNRAFLTTLPPVPSYRFVDCTDVVCGLPPWFWGYRHLGPARYFDRAGQERVNATPTQVIADHLLGHLSYAYHWAWRPGMVWVRGLADHAPINYVTAAEYSNT
jgi:triacylglycerol lipase